MRILFALTIVTCDLLVACGDEKPTDKITATSKVEFKIDGTVERIDSAYADGTHRLSTFMDAKTMERKAVVKFHDNGQPYTDLRFASGAKNGESKSYYANGNVWSLNTYRNDTLHGTYKTWHQNGQLYFDGAYNNGKEDGEWFTYFMDGRLDTRGRYRDGDKAGVWTTYNKEGVLMREVDYAKAQKHN